MIPLKTIAILVEVTNHVCDPQRRGNREHPLPISILS